MEWAVSIKSIPLSALDCLVELLLLFMSYPDDDSNNRNELLRNQALVGGLDHFLFPHILGTIIPSD